ncbi:MAG: D-alanyl-D-alanine carboxypeptidase [Lachnospiraceae bacterium]|nr:D-alanyl-D-alanine carboxypeptidase [Lachnospiraceae bacterium]
MYKFILNLMIMATLNSFDVNVLNSISAVVIDAESGRVLVGKNENNILPNASTTKILTCILAIENCEMDDIVTVSKYASGMPDVQLNIKEGQKFYLKDLLFSLMLESHNDSAVAIAEHISGNVEKFSKLMNEKARELGCYNTNFVTPNGLDGENENGIHSTTAYDLALIMKYCMNNDKFLEITSTLTHSFVDLEGKSSYTVNNKNALLRENVGVISGKTGFTSKAGYCYVCACEDEGRRFVVSLLACGWPPAKNKKWIDCRKLLSYAKENYIRVKYSDLEIDMNRMKNVSVIDGVKDCVDIEIGKLPEGGILINANEKIELEYNIKDTVNAPVNKGDIVGEINYMINGKKYCSVPLLSNIYVERKGYRWCVQNVLNKVLF